MSKTTKAELKVLVRSAYDFQEDRIRTGNRVAMNFLVKLGHIPGKKSEETMDKESDDVVKRIRTDYKKMMDGIKVFPTPKKFKALGIITSYAELCMVEQYIKKEETEKEMFSRFDKVLQDFPIYKFLKDKVPGCGPMLSGMIIAEIDIHKAEYPSSIWAYCGLDVAPDGRGRSRRKEHMAPRTYKDKDGEDQTCNSLTYNPKLKCKLMGVLSGCMIRVAGESPYKDAYYNYKHRLESRPDWAERSKGHRDKAAKRYMVKRMIVDLYKEWRALEGLPVAPEYSEAKLGMKHKRAGGGKKPPSR